MALTAAELDRVVAELIEIERRVGLDRTLAIGKLILERFFEGDPASFRDRRKNKGNSIRRLAQRKACPLGKSALNEAVAVYVAVCETPSVRTYGQITASHVAAVLPLPAHERERLLSLADKDGLGVRALRARAVALRREGGERRGRPSVTREQSALTALLAVERRLLTALDDLESFTELSASARSALQALADRLRAIEARLRAYGRASADVRARLIIN